MLSHRSHCSRSRVPALLLAALVAAGLPAPLLAQDARVSREARLRDMAATFLGGTVGVVEDLFPGEDLDAALLDPLGGGMRDLEQSLGTAVFAVPVAGNIGYVLRPQLYHDLPIVFPPTWRPVSVLVADENRWRYARHDSMVLLQPGEVGARTNMTVIFDTGELLQLDLEEVTGSFGRTRTGRVYIGPEGWLVERIFALMPADVRDRIITAVRGGEVRVSELLADPIAVIREHGAFDALPPEEDDRFARAEAAERAGSLARAALRRGRRAGTGRRLRAPARRPQPRRAPAPAVPDARILAGPGACRRGRAPSTRGSRLRSVRSPGACPRCPRRTPARPRAPRSRPLPPGGAGPAASVPRGLLPTSSSPRTLPTKPTGEPPADGVGPVPRCSFEPVGRARRSLHRSGPAAASGC